jgi:coiled-coil domain-containing protein 130
LEHGVQDQRKAAETVPVLTQLQRLNEAQWSDPYTLSQQLRRKFREQKKLEKANVEKADKLKDKMSLHIDLVDEHPEDEIRAKLTEFEGKGRKHKKKNKNRNQWCLTSFIFSLSLSHADPIIASAEKRKKEAEVGPLFSSKRRHRDLNGSAKADLASRLVTQTRRKVDPFLQKASSFGQASKQDALADIVVVKQSNAKEGSC